MKLKSSECTWCHGARVYVDEEGEDCACPKCDGTGQAAPPPNTKMQPAPASRSDRDPFLPPEDIEWQCKEYIEALRAYKTPQPREAPPTLVGGPNSLDRHQAAQVLTAAAGWMEFISTEISDRKAVAQVMRAAVNWMDRFVKFAHKGKVAGLTQAQFDKFQDYTYRLDLVEAEIAALEGLAAQQKAIYMAASRNLTGEIAPRN